MLNYFNKKEQKVIKEIRIFESETYNNIIDADSALQCASFMAQGFPGRYVCVIVKHNNPCGVALGNSYLEAYEKAFKTDPTSAFGGIIAFGYYNKYIREINSGIDLDLDIYMDLPVINADVAKKRYDNIVKGKGKAELTEILESVEIEAAK